MKTAALITGTVPRKKARSPFAWKQTAVTVIILAILIALFLLLWMRTIALGYFGSYIQRNTQIKSVMEMNPGLQYSSSEKENLVELETDWDAFRNSHLRDHVSVLSPDGITLSGYLYDLGAENTLLVLPQYNETGTSDFLYGPYFVEHGFNLLLVDSRAHGLSEGGYCGFGWLEYGDITSWLDWIERELSSSHIVIYGAGMGANAALLWAAQDNTPAKVELIIAESPYASLLEEAKYTLLKTHSVSWFPFGMAVQWKIEHENIGYTAESAVLDADTLAGADTPVLFLSASKDDYIPEEYTLLAYDAYPGPKELYQADCRHGLVYGTQREAVQALLAQWGGF